MIKEEATCGDGEVFYAYDWWKRGEWLDFCGWTMKHRRGKYKFVDVDGMYGY